MGQRCRELCDEPGVPWNSTAKGCSKTGGAGGDPTKNNGFNGIKLTLNGMKQVTTIDI